MPSRSVMGQVVTTGSYSTGTQLAGEAVERKGPHRAEPRLSATEKRNREAAQLIAEAIKICGPASIAAELSDGADRKVDETQVSRWASGKESMPARALLPILRDPDAALALLTAMSRYAGLAPPTKPRKVTADECDRVLARKVRVTAEVFAIYRSHVAAALGTTEEDVDAAYAEPVAK
jgi:hypothetical protein